MTTLSKTSCTVSLEWPGAIFHTPFFLLYGKLHTSSYDYQNYCLQVRRSSQSRDPPPEKSVELAMRSFWSASSGKPYSDYSYENAHVDIMNYYKTHQLGKDVKKPSGFKNGVTIRFPFGVVKLFRTGKVILTSSMNMAISDQVDEVERYVRELHPYNLPEVQCRIVSINALGQWKSPMYLNGKQVWNLYDVYSVVRNFFDFRCEYNPEYHKGFMQVYFSLGDKDVTTNIYASGKCIVYSALYDSHLHQIEKHLNHIFDCVVSERNQKVLGMIQDILEMDEVL